ncbi:bifunctional phosphopantothenoylcysteine decarboxylase/phosphopantothenate--cysteine ligase CoaBC [Micrococcoides hystricis]|uniref:Coenzyme A biosynthesis bifunctional protein CoaBC n=1 Tax=Micrococcoides hystricis TaxID=1572761 RepID=A0ABV6P7G0_9MICC
MRIVLGVTGGIAAYKAALLLRLLTEARNEVHVIPTEAALNFVGKATWEALSGNPVHTSTFAAVEDVNHVAQGQHADLVVIAPTTADTLAKIAAGLAPDLLTNTVLATTAPVVLVPAMHTEMWQNPATVANVETLRSRGVIVMEPASGRLTGQDSGPGRLPEPEDIVAFLNAEVVDLSSGTRMGPLTGRKVLISAGGTREPLDPVRFLGNSSSGKQGVALAAAARRAGAEVTLLAAHMDVAPPAGVKVIPTPTAADLQAAVTKQAPSHDVLIMAAAVADYRPESVAEAKMKKGPGENSLTLTLVENPDILAEAVAKRNAKRRPSQRKKPRPRLIAGFAAETGDKEHSVLEYGQAKLEKKQCDLLFVNDVSGGAGFGRDDNAVTILALDQDTPVAEVAGSKDDVAETMIRTIADRL